jgi:hypothetical protein
MPEAFARYSSPEPNLVLKINDDYSCDRSFEADVQFVIFIE